MPNELDDFFKQPFDPEAVVRRDTREEAALPSLSTIDEPVKVEEKVEPEQVIDPASTPAAPASPAPPAETEKVVDPELHPDPSWMKKDQAPAPAPAPTLTWKDILKEEGYGDFEIELLEYYKSTGDFTPYIEAKSVDYSKLSDEDILRRDLQAKYKDLSQDELDLLYKKRVVEKYNLDEMYSEEEQKLGRIELKYDTQPIRERLAEDQKKFRAPEKEVQTPVDQTQVLQAQAQQWKSTVDADPITHGLLNSKILAIGSGEQVANFEVSNVESVLEKTYNPQRFFESFTRQDGSVDLAKWYKVIAFAENMDMYDRTSINHGKTIGRKEVFEELKNPPKPEVGSVPGGGTGDFRTDILNEFAKNGVHRG